MSERRKLTKGQLWAMSLAGAATVRESKNLNNVWDVGGFPLTDTSREWAKNCSKKLYGIESRKDLLEWIEDLTQVGQSTGMQNELDNLPDDPTTDNYRQRLLRNNADVIRRCGCLGWDIGRAAVITGWSTLGGYITEEEFWQLMKPMAQRVQTTYTSWKEYADGYELGRAYWAEGAEHKPTADATHELLTNPKSPWVLLGWDSNLDYIPLPGHTPGQNSGTATPPNNAANNNDDPEIFPGQPIARLGDYVKLMRMAQSGQMMQAMAELGIDMMAYSQAMQRWGQKMATDPALAIKFSQLLSGVSAAQTSVQAAVQSTSFNYYEQEAVFNTVPHFIVNEKLGLALHFHRDYDNKQTRVSLVKPVAAGFELVKEENVDDLLNFPADMGDRWLAGTMKVRKWGEPAYIEEWDWKSLQQITRYLIKHEKFGLMHFAISPNFKTVLVDRFFPPDGTGHARIFSYPDLQELGTVDINSNCLSPSFNSTGDKLVWVHTDQSDGEMHLWEQQDGKFVETKSFAEKVIAMDFTYTGTNFTPQGIFLFKLHGEYIDVYLFSETGDEQKWHVNLEKNFYKGIKRVLDDTDFDEDRFTDYLFNTVLIAHTDATHAYVGGVGKVYQIDLATGAVVKEIFAAGMSLIVQVRRLGDTLVVVDHRNLLGKVSL